MKKHQPFPLEELSLEYSHDGMGTEKWSPCSLALFCQAKSSQVIQGPKGKYPAISARDNINRRIAADFVGLHYR